MHRETFGDALAKLHAEQQAGSVNALESLSLGLEGNDAPTWTHRVLVASNHILLGAAHLSKDLLLDLPARGTKAEARAPLSRCDLLERCAESGDCDNVEGEKATTFTAKVQI